MPMQFGITSLVGHTLPFDAFCRLAARLGYSHVEPSLVRGYFEHFNAFQLTADAERQAACKQIICAQELKCSALDAHGLFRQNPDETDYNIAYFRKALRLAPVFGTRLVITSIPGGALPWNEMTARTRDLCQEAAEMGLTIAIEAEYGFAVGTPDELERFLDETGAPNLAVNYDPSHFVRAGFGVVETVRRFAKRIVHVHLKEYLPEAVPPTLFTGEHVGSPAWQLLDELAAIGYDGVASVETLAELTLSAEAVASTAWKAIRKWQEKHV